MLKIRLQRVGRKHEPAFRLVLTDSKNSTKSGRFKEILGFYDPRKSVDAINAEKVRHWLSLGAHPTGTVHNLLVNHKVIDGKKVNVLPKKTVVPKEPVAAETPVETPAEGGDKIEESPAAEKIGPEGENTAEQSAS